MSRPKKVEETNEGTTKTTATNDKTITDLKRQLTTLKNANKKAEEANKKAREEEAKKIAGLEQQVSLLAQIVENMNQINTEVEQNQEEEDDFLENTFAIYTRALTSSTIRSAQGDVVKVIERGEACLVDEEEFKKLMKNGKTRQRVEEDIVYFKDESLYKKTKIKKKIDMSDDFLINFLKNKEVVEVENLFNEYTRFKKNNPVFHCLFYRIVELDMQGHLNNMDYDIRKFIEKYFSFRIDDAKMLTRRVESVL